MNDNLPAIAAMGKRELKRMRKFVRKVLRADLQRRAITGEPSPFKRAPTELPQ